VPDFEKLGVFYLGRPYDLAQKQGKEGYTLYDSKDLVTHAVCVGMTGSGKVCVHACSKKQQLMASRLSSLTPRAI
jgi:hypothetical protein